MLAQIPVRIFRNMGPQYFAPLWDAFFKYVFSSLSDNIGNIGDKYRLQGTPACVNVFMASNLFLLDGACGSIFSE